MGGTDATTIARRDDDGVENEYADVPTGVSTSAATNDVARRRWRMNDDGSGRPRRRRGMIEFCVCVCSVWVSVERDWRGVRGGGEGCPPISSYGRNVMRARR